MTQYEPVIGLEIHAELQTNSKMFCSCSADYSNAPEPNTFICPVCTGLPGAMPVLNKKAIEQATLVGLALNCSINEFNTFARKNYFYPDLPKGYQISQYDLPIASKGWLDILDDTDSPMRVVVRRVHLEEDTAKLSHEKNYALVDFNRAGVPLLEIVSEPDMRTVEAALSYATKIRAILRYLGVNAGDMEKGILRFEANISVRPSGSSELRTRTEIKNLNSFRALTRASAYEIERQIKASASTRPRMDRLDQGSTSRIAPRKNCALHFGLQVDSVRSAVAYLRADSCQLLREHCCKIEESRKNNPLMDRGRVHALYE
jgi:aspartyl-tRNA(Asn)/glutamyl-tRNA(Gln) amidotransferase subunit B